MLTLFIIVLTILYLVMFLSHVFIALIFFPIWYNWEMKSMAIEKKKLSRRWKRVHQKDDEDEVKYLRRKCISLSKVCFDNYFDNSLGKLQSFFVIAAFF